MAVGLGLLGRGGTRRALGLWALHVAGAALAGALLGGLVGGLGALVELAAWGPWIIGGGSRLPHRLYRPPRRSVDGRGGARTYFRCHVRRGAAGDCPATAPGSTRPGADDGLAGDASSPRPRPERGAHRCRWLHSRPHRPLT